MKILITGTHFTPAVAVIEELKKMGDVNIVYVGRKNTLEGDSACSIESQVLPSLGVKFAPIIAGRLQRSFTLYTIPSLLKIPVGFIQALYIILSEKPDIILSFGGYLAVPVVFWGWLWSIPIIIHEQTLVSGLANKISALFADKVCLSFAKNPLTSKENVILTGNPIRKEITQPKDNLEKEYKSIFNTAKEKNLPVILITGGNQGSHVLNLAVEKVLDKLTKIALIIHATGDNKFHDFDRLEKMQNEYYLVRKWINDEWGAVLAKIDLAVSRAGANTLSELAYLGKPTLVIPIPYLYQDEQNKNAAYFKKLGLVRILPQHELSPESLLFEIATMLKNLAPLTTAAKNAKTAVITGAAKRIALETMLLVKI